MVVATKSMVQDSNSHKLNMHNAKQLDDDTCVHSAGMPTGTGFSKSFAAIVAEGNTLGPWSNVSKQVENVDSNGISASADCSKNSNWQVKTKKKRKPKLGKKEDSSLKVVKHFSKPAEIFISRLEPNTTEAQLNSFVQSQFMYASSVSCNKLKTKFDSYSSFHVSLTGVSFADALILDNWPAGALVKRFYAPNNSNSSSSDNSDSQSTTA